MVHSNVRTGCAACSKSVLFGAFFLSLLFFAASVQAAANSLQLNRVIAVVNGELISMYDLQQHAMPEIIRRGLTGGDQRAVEEREQIFNESLESMIMDILYKQEAERYMISVEDGDVENEVRKIMQGNNFTQEEFERQLTLQGMTLDELRGRLRDSLMRQRLLGAMVTRKAEVTPEEVEAYYRDHPEQFSTQSSIEFSVILLGPGRDAAAVYEEITSGRISFADAARKYSDSPTAALGGRMGNIPWKDLNPAWSGALRGLRDGQTAAPVAAGDSTVLLHVDALHEGDSQDFESVAPEIEDMLREERLRERFEEYSAQLRSKAVVEIKI